MKQTVKHDLEQLVSMGYIDYVIHTSYIELRIIPSYKTVWIQETDIPMFLRGFMLGIDAQRAKLTSAEKSM